MLLLVINNRCFVLNQAKGKGINSDVGAALCRKLFPDGASLHIFVT